MGMRTAPRLITSLLAVAILIACAPSASPPARPTAAPAPTVASAPAAPPAAAQSSTTGGAAAGPAAAPSAPPAPETVHIGWVRSINGAPFFVAMGRGYYTQAGLNVETAEFRSAADIVGALGTGQLDVNLGTISAGTFNAWQRGVKMIVGAAMSVYPAEGLQPSNVVVRKDLYDNGAVRSAADFRGRRIAMNVQGGINEIMVWKILARRGVGMEEVELQTMPFPDMIAALANASTDVLTAPDPYGTMAIDQGVGVRLEEDQRSVGELQPVHLLFSENFAVNRADVAVRFLAATMRGARELQSNWLADPAVGQIIEDEVGFKRDLLARSVLPRYPADLQVEAKDLEVFQDAFLKLGHLSYSTPLDVTPFFNSTLTQRAKAQLDAGR
jgi:NitT/TauT family transport system substrate-binding protein